MTHYEERYIQAQAVLQRWVNQQGHDRCWYYPDLFRELAVILEVTPTKDPSLPSLEEFKRGCEQYQREEFQLEK